MRILHTLHVIALIALFSMGIHWLGEMEMISRAIDTGIQDIAVDSDKELLYIIRLAAFAGMVVFAFSAILGWQVSLKRRYLGILWGLLGAVNVIWMALIWKTPTHTELIEVIPFWMFYLMAGVVASVYCLLMLKDVPPEYLSTYQGDELLDS